MNCEQWNAKHPIGTAVIFTRVDGIEVRSVTTAKATSYGPEPHRQFVMIERIGSVVLGSVRVVIE